MSNLTQEEWQNELEAQIDGHGPEKMVFFLTEEDPEPDQLVIVDVRFNEPNIEVTFEKQ